MIPPQRINILDQTGGFTAITTKRGDNLWRPEYVLKGYPPIGDLISFDEHSFFQNNNNVTSATYKVKGYRYVVELWFDNRTEERIA